MKLGPHCINLTEQALSWVQRAPIVKALDVPAPLHLAQPGAITIFRAFVQYQDDISPRDFFDLTLHRLDGFRPTYIEGLNEYKARMEYGLADYITWTEEFTKLAHIAGYKVAGFSFPTGNPEIADWSMLRDRNFAGVDALSIHEYWGIGGPANSDWNALRHRKVHEYLGGDHPPMLITECGMDAIEGAMAGWKNNGLSAGDYLAQLLLYNAELEQDDYVLGATVYTCGPTPDWAHFDVDEIAGRIPSGTSAVFSPEVPKMPEFVLGFKSYADTHPEVGAAVSDLLYDANGTGVQYTENGKLEWCKEADKVYFFQSGR